MENLPTGTRSFLIQLLTPLLIASCNQPSDQSSKPNARFTIRNQNAEVATVDENGRGLETAQSVSKREGILKKTEISKPLGPLTLIQAQDLTSYSQIIEPLNSNRKNDCTYLVSRILSHLSLVERFTSPGRAEFEPYAPNLQKELLTNKSFERINSLDQISQAAVLFFLGTDKIPFHAIIVVKYINNNQVVDFLAFENSESTGRVIVYPNKERVEERINASGNTQMFNVKGSLRF